MHERQKEDEPEQVEQGSWHSEQILWVAFGKVPFGQVEMHELLWKYPIEQVKHWVSLLQVAQGGEQRTQVPEAL